MGTGLDDFISGDLGEIGVLVPIQARRSGDEGVVGLMKKTVTFFLISYPSCLSWGICLVTACDSSISESAIPCASSSGVCVAGFQQRYGVS